MSGLSIRERFREKKRRKILSTGVNLQTVPQDWKTHHRAWIICSTERSPPPSGSIHQWNLVGIQRLAPARGAGGNTKGGTRRTVEAKNAPPPRNSRLFYARKAGAAKLFVGGEVKSWREYQRMSRT